MISKVLPGFLQRHPYGRIGFYFLFVAMLLGPLTALGEAFMESLFAPSPEVLREQQRTKIWVEVLMMTSKDPDGAIVKIREEMQRDPEGSRRESFDMLFETAFAEKLKYDPAGARKDLDEFMGKNFISRSLYFELLSKLPAPQRARPVTTSR